MKRSTKKNVMGSAPEPIRIGDRVMVIFCSWDVDLIGETAAVTSSPYISRIDIDGRITKEEYLVVHLTRGEPEKDGVLPVDWLMKLPPDDELRRQFAEEKRQSSIA